MEKQSVNADNCEPCTNISRIKTVSTICKIISNNDEKCEELETQRILNEIDTNTHIEQTLELQVTTDETANKILNKLKEP